MVLNKQFDIKPKKILFLLLNPTFIAFYLFLILVLFVFPDYFTKYTMEIVDRKQTNRIEYYHDLNGDGISEEIVIGYDQSDHRDILVLHSNLLGGVYDQWGFRGKWLKYLTPIFGDYNHNGYAEIYCLSCENDSIFLSAKELMLPGGFEIKNRFVCKYGTYKDDKQDLRNIGGKLMDIDRNGLSEYLFVIHGGFSIFPRNAFAYYIDKDSLVMSPASASGFRQSLDYLDMNNDGVDEITGAIGSPENIHYPMLYTDSACWLMVLNPVKMDFLFNPVRFDLGIGSQVNPVFYNISGKKYIAISTYCNSARLNRGYHLMCIYNSSGKKVHEKKFSKKQFKRLSFVNPGINNNKYFYLIDNFGSTYKTDTSMELINLYRSDLNILGGSEPNMIDADGDDKKEMVTIEKNKYGELIFQVYQQNLSELISIKLPGTTLTGQVHFQIINSGKDKSPLIMTQIGDDVFKIKYGKNPYYLLKYPAYAGLYFILFFMFWMLQKVQSGYARQKLETEKQLMRQKIAISKKQMEPHFMLNVLNNISTLFMKEDKETAQYYFGKFSSLIHHSLKYADKTETTLSEELNFVRNYLILQSGRMENGIDFEIIVDESIEVDKELIPHSLLFTFVENAIKHGLRPKPDNRKLSIGIGKQIERIVIIIKDNGIGRQQSKILKTSGTRKGLEIISNIVESYNKLKNKNITFNITDLKDGKDNTGTEVTIQI